MQRQAIWGEFFSQFESASWTYGTRSSKMNVALWMRYIMLEKDRLFKKEKLMTFGYI